jgi:hypothetical protein
MSLMTFSSTNPSTASSDRRGLTAAWRPRLVKKKMEEEEVEVEVKMSEMMVVEEIIEGSRRVRWRWRMRMRSGT